jgi:pimeloyl-ACP methyl ester carboxylesterase
MASYDELDREIDREMGWDRGEPGIGSPATGSIRRRPDYWQALLRNAGPTSPIGRTISTVWRAIAKVVFFPIISPLGYSKKFNVQGDMVIVKRSLMMRFVDGIFTRILLTPVILGIFMIAVVYASTHPRNVRADSSPDAYGLYFKRLSITTIDNQRLTAWYIPPISAEEVAFDVDGTLVQKYPGVVLCHGLGATHDQYLPLAAQLHTAGYAVLMLDMRGQGESDQAAVTYGLRERMDVLAAIKVLRETSYVDPAKVCVVGHNIGATAALQAAALDSSVAAVVADGLWPKFEERARDIFGHPRASTGNAMATQWLAPLYTIAFEIAVRDRLNQLDPETVVRAIHTQPVLFIARTGPDYAPVQEVVTLASQAGGRHEVIPADFNWEGKIVGFLNKNLSWKGPKARGTEQIKNLLKSSVEHAK